MTNTKSLQDKHRGKYIFFLLLHLRCHGQLYFFKNSFLKLKRQSPFVKNKKFLVSFNIFKKKPNTYRLHKVISLLKQKRINLLIWEACKWNWLMPYWTVLLIFKFPKSIRYIIVNRTYTGVGYNMLAYMREQTYPNIPRRQLLSPDVNYRNTCICT